MKAWGAASTASETGEPLGSACCFWMPKATQQSACIRRSVLPGAQPRKPLEKPGQTLGPGICKGDEGSRQVLPW